jgi:hypothetical protein
MLNENLIKHISLNTNGSYDITLNRGSNGMNLIEVDWKDVPRFRADGTQMTNEEFKESIIKKHGIQSFSSNFANEFLGSSHTLISSDKLQEMQEEEELELRDGKLKIYEYPEKNHKYIMTVDASKDGTDAFGVQVVDITDFEFRQVAAAKLQIDYLLMPEFIYDWCEYYNNPYLIIENNEGAGQSVADQLYQTYEYENLHFDKKTDSNSKNITKLKKSYPGFRTTVKSRKQILQTMKLFIENNKLNLRDKSTIDEFFQFILINNKFQADNGAHDDMIMSLALVFAPFNNAKNFDDMKKLVKNLYSTETDENEKANFSELFTLGGFYDGTQENEDFNSRKSTFNEFDIENEFQQIQQDKLY